MAGAILTLDGVHASYKEKEILRGVFLEIHDKETVVLLGANGSGKSTTLKTISGLLPITRGQIRLGGEDISLWDSAHRQAAGISYLLQGGRVFPNLTVQENFNVAIRYRRGGVVPNGHFLGSVFPGLAGLCRRRAGLLSGGQQQMLAIEMVTAQCGVVGLWDEPTAGLSDEMAIAALNHIVVLANRGSAQLIVEQRDDLLSGLPIRTIQIEDLYSRE